jgi:hypothetical protein
MDTKIRDSASGRTQPVLEPDNHQENSKDRIYGACSRCGEATSYIVKFADKWTFLCPPCGNAIRQNVL